MECPYLLLLPETQDPIYIDFLFDMYYYSRCKYFYAELPVSAAWLGAAVSNKGGKL